MKNRMMILIGALFITTGACGGAFERIGREMDEMRRRMDVVFDEMHERTASRKIEAPDYDVHIHEEGDNVILTLALSQGVKPEDISVEVEDGFLEVLIDGPDKIELMVADQCLTIMASHCHEQKEQDNLGNIQVIASGSAHMSQSLSLPSRVDVNKAPKASLDDGVLTLTLAKKGPQKIAVTSSSDAVKTPAIQDHKEPKKVKVDAEDIENLK